MISSVAILGQVWVNAVSAVIAMRAPDLARAAYSFMQSLVHAAAAPLSVVALVSGVVLGLGTKWGALRFRWVTAKLVLLAVATWLSVRKPGGRVRR